MKPRIYGLIGIVALLTGYALGCKEDPTAAGVGTPSAVVLEFSSLTLGPGDSARVVARIVDSRLTPLQGSIAFSTCDAAVATVVSDPTFNPAPPLAKRAVIHAVSAPATCIIASSSGAKPDSVSVGVIPTTFVGTPSTTSPQVGQFLTLSSTATLKFGASSDIDFGGGVYGFVTSQTADAITVAVPQPETPAAGPVTAENVSVTYVPGLSVDLPTSTSFSAITSSYAPHDAPDPAVTLTIPADGAANLVFYDGFKSTDVDFFYQWTLTKTDTLTFTLDWLTGADLDMANCTVGCGAFVGGFGAAGASHPEKYTVIFPPGTYNLLVEQFDPAGEPAHSFKVTIQNP